MCVCGGGKQLKIPPRVDLGGGAPPIVKIRYFLEGGSGQPGNPSGYTLV